MGDQCENNYSSNAALNDHIQSIHIGVSLNCKYCNLEFKSKPALNTHQRYHCQDNHNIVKEKCPNCSLTLSNKPALQSHIRYYCKFTDPSEQYRKHKCNTCGKAYGKKGDLIKHSKSCKKYPGGEASMAVAATMAVGPPIPIISTVPNVPIAYHHAI